MLWGQDRSKLREMYSSAWRDFKAGKTLDKQTQMIAAVIAMHPEYQPDIESGAVLHRDYDGSDGQSNPFLHMGMHLAIHEQLSIDRPPGIVAIHQQLSRRAGDEHQAEHQMLEVLAQVLWDAQQAHREPDIEEYVEGLRRVVSVS